MMNFIEKPNLPKTEVKLALCGKAYKDVISFIEKQGIDLITFDDNEYLDNGIRNHADINIHHLGGKHIVIDKGQKDLGNNLSNIGMCVKFTNNEIKSPYPTDCALNCFETEKYIFCKASSTESIVMEYAKKRKLKIIDVSQGYCKCSVLLLSDSSFITDDLSIYKKGVEVGFDCLLIEKGDIFLEGYNYGFIGGASALIDKNKVMFFGDITKHRSFDIIDKFLKERKIEYIYTDKFQLCDIGGIIPLV